MKENLLHFIWKYKKLQLKELVDSIGQSVVIIDAGTHNQGSGPDFFNAQVSIGGQHWAGNVEIHLKSSDWYAHHHEKDPNYNSVILHVVWEDDATVFRGDNSEIPTLELKNYIPDGVLKAYKDLFDKNNVQFINCEKNITQVDSFLLDIWLERLYFERLQRKSETVGQLLHTSKNDWEQVLFAMLTKNFGLKINGASFFSLAHALRFSTVRKLQYETLALESVFFGMAHLLDSNEILDEYYNRLKDEFKHLQNKFGLENASVQKPEFFKLRPPNFPTIRLSQLANLYTKEENLFSKVISESHLDNIRNIFEVSASPYWNDHFTFGKTSKKSKKQLSKKFIDLLVINTILPLKFSYAKYHGKEVNDEIIQIITQIKSESNNIIDNFDKYGISIENAKQSQAVLQLYNEYCSKNKCLQCAVGNSLLHGNS